MSSSVVGICNLALSRCGLGQIQSVTDASKQARECMLLFYPTLDAVLSDFPWNFATKREALADTSETITGWTFGYAFPNECLRVQEIYNPASQAKADRIKYQVGLNAAGNRKVIYTNQEKAELVYTQRVRDPNLFDPVFIKAMSYALAAELALPLRGDTQMKDLLRREYMAILSLAQAANANENEQRPQEISSYERARG